MSARHGAGWLAALSLWAAAPAFATGDDDAAERARIAAERAAGQVRLAERERECAGRFVVTACVEDARREQRATLAALRQQLTVLDETQRRQRAAERLDKLAKPRANPPHPQTAAASREPHGGPGPVEVSPAGGAGPRPPPQHTTRSPTAAAPLDPLDRHTQRQTRQAAKQADFAARQQAAQVRRAAAEKRQAERSKKGRAAHPLPVPASAAAP